MSQVRPERSPFLRCGDFSRGGGAAGLGLGRGQPLLQVRLRWGRAQSKPGQGACLRGWDTETLYDPGDLHLAVKQSGW